MTDKSSTTITSSLVSGSPLIFGHRGMPLRAPENTLASFDLCIEHGIPGIELDVHLCASGEVVVFHDFDFSRIGQVEGRVETSTFDRLSTIDVGSWFSPEFSGQRIPSLQEIITRYGDHVLFDIELKEEGVHDSGLASATWELIERNGMMERCIVSSFNPFSIRRFRKVSQGAVLTALIYTDSPDIPAPLRRGGGVVVARPHMMKPNLKQVEDCRGRLVSRIRRRPFIVWTVDSAEDLRRFTALGASGIISNDPLLGVIGLE